MNVDQFDTEAFRTDKLELTSGNIADHNGNVVSGVFNIHSSDYVLNADLVNDRTWDTSKSNYGYGIVAMNSDGHLTINGNGMIGFTSLDKREERTLLKYLQMNASDTAGKAHGDKKEEK